jgi:hypothetical protein
MTEKRIEVLEEKVGRLEVALALERQDPEEMARLGLSMDGAANRKTLCIIERENLKVEVAALQALLLDFVGDKLGRVASITCGVTHNRCGTDTEAVGCQCECVVCNLYRRALRFQENAP